MLALCVKSNKLNQELTRSNFTLLDYLSCPPLPVAGRVVINLCAEIDDKVAVSVCTVFPVKLNEIYMSIFYQSTNNNMLSDFPQVWLGRVCARRSYPYPRRAERMSPLDPRLKKTIYSTNPIKIN